MYSIPRCYRCYMLQNIQALGWLGKDIATFQRQRRPQRAAHTLQRAQYTVAVTQTGFGVSSLAALSYGALYI